MHKLEIKFIGLDDNLRELVRQIDLSEWDGDNEIDKNDFTSESLAAYTVYKGLETPPTA